MIFLDLHKAYDALDRSRCLDILKGYGMGPWARFLLQMFWRRLTVVARAVRYYGMAFKQARVVTQGDPLSPTISNVVVEELARHWVTVMVEGAEEWGERGN